MGGCKEKKKQKPYWEGRRKLTCPRKKDTHLQMELWFDLWPPLCSLEAEAPQAVANVSRLKTSEAHDSCHHWQDRAWDVWVKSAHWDSMHGSCSEHLLALLVTLCHKLYHLSSLRPKSLPSIPTCQSMQSLYQSVAGKLLLIILHHQAWQKSLHQTNWTDCTLQTQNISIMGKDRHWKKNEWEWDQNSNSLKCICTIICGLKLEDWSSAIFWFL